MARWTRVLAVAIGYAVAVLAAGALVELGSRSRAPADVAASSGMFAFGDLLWFLLLAGLFSLPPTWLLARMLRRAERLWRSLARASLPWGATAPLATAFALWGSGGPAAPLAFLRTLASPVSLVVMGVTWRMVAEPAARRRVLHSMALEACGLIALVAWIARALLAGAHR
jgi:hypothetical protein